MRTLMLLILLFIFLINPGAEGLPDSILVKLENLVKEYDNPDEPGYAMAIVKDQQLVFKHAGGLANLEYNIPLTTESVFNIASISKQFTAFSIALLLAEEKLNLEDPLTFYFPELPEIYNHVKIRHLIHMESGIRDFYILHHLRGRGENIYSTTIGETLELLAMQKALYFPPGNQTDYCNTNYLLLAEIVKRISGETLREFTHNRIFKPLGMNNTHFHDDRTEVVKNRAAAYYLGEFSEIFIFRDMHSDSANIRKGFKVAPESYVFDLVGQSQLYTTVEDLYLWDRNFYSGEVGGRELIDMLHTTSTLNNGEKNNYAFGLFIGTYGPSQLKTVSHTGGTNGYLSNYIRFPDEEFSVIFTTNNTGFDDSIIDRAIQICLGEKLQTRSRGLTIQRQAVPFAPADFDPFAGEYELLPGFTVNLTRENNRFYVQPSGQEKVEIFPSSDTSFFLRIVEAQITFHPEDSGSCTELTWHQGGQNYMASKILPEGKLKKDHDFNEYTGTFYSNELDVTYTIYLNDGHLYLRYKPYLQVFTEPLISRGGDKFHAQAMWKVEFERDRNGKIESMFLISPVGIGKIGFTLVR